MSEKLFALLLRLYPSDFRHTYGEESLRLFRDRARDEKGFNSVLRLWFDMLSDAAISLPRQYVRAHSMLAAAPAPRSVVGAPAFFILEDQPVRVSALFSGGVLSLFALGLACGAVLYSGTRLGFAAPFLGDPQPRSKLSQELRPQPQPGEDTDAHKAAKPGVGTLLAEERRRVLYSAIKNLKTYYPYQSVAQETADSLLAHEKNGDDDAATNGPAFADLITAQMRNASHDMHLDMVYSAFPLPDHPATQTPEAQAAYHSMMERQNCTIEKAQLLRDNLGYLKINSFPDTSVCRDDMTSAMASLDRADAIIFDLRENRGGFPDMVALLTAYLFDHPEYLYNPRENTTQRSWTHSPVPGNHLADKPVYILTSSRTISAAEQFAYDLKMLRRATVVGEKTAGAAHSAVFHRIDEHFGMGIPEATPINPFSTPDWATTGVEPDVKVSSADALAVAQKLARSAASHKWSNRP